MNLNFNLSSQPHPGLEGAQFESKCSSSRKSSLHPESISKSDFSEVLETVEALTNQGQVISEEALKKRAGSSPSKDLLISIMLNLVTGLPLMAGSSCTPIEEVTHQAHDGSNELVGTVEEVSDQSTSELSRDKVDDNNLRGPVGILVQMGRNIANKKSLFANFGHDDTSNVVYYFSAGAMGLHYGPNNVCFGFNALKSLVNIISICDDCLTGKANHDTSKLKESVSELKKIHLDDLENVDDLELQQSLQYSKDQITLLMKKIDVLEKIKFCNSSIDIFNDLKRIAETIVAFGILAGGSGVPVAFGASIFKTVFAAANLHLENQITQFSDEFNLYALEELKVNFDREAPEKVNQIFQDLDNALPSDFQFNRLDSRYKALLCYRMHPHIKTGDFIYSNLVDRSFTWTPAKNSELFKQSLELGERFESGESDLDETSKTELDLVEGVEILDGKLDVKEETYISNYRNYKMLVNNYPVLKEKIDLAFREYDHQRILNWTDKLPLLLYLVEKGADKKFKEMDKELEKIIKFRLQLVSSENTTMQFIARSKGVTQDVYDDMSCQLRKYEIPGLSTKDKHKGMDDLINRILQIRSKYRYVRDFKSYKEHPKSARRDYRNELANVDSSVINYVENKYYESISKELKIKEKNRSSSSTGKEELGVGSDLDNTKSTLELNISELETKKSQPPPKELYIALARFDFDVKKKFENKQIKLQFKSKYRYLKKLDLTYEKKCKEKGIPNALSRDLLDSWANKFVVANLNPSFDDMFSTSATIATSNESEKMKPVAQMELSTTKPLLDEAAIDELNKLTSTSKRVNKTDLCFKILDSRLKFLENQLKEDPELTKEIKDLKKAKEKLKEYIKDQNAIIDRQTGGKTSLLKRKRTAIDELKRVFHEGKIECGLDDSFDSNSDSSFIINFKKIFKIFEDKENYRQGKTRPQELINFLDEGTLF